jgi:hypothetical protein
MAHHTVKLGGADSHAVVAKVAVSFLILIDDPSHSRRSFVRSMGL